MTTNWQDRCTFMNPQSAGIPMPVGEGTVKFYPVSPGKLFELRAIAQPLAKAMMTLMANNANDTGMQRGTDEEGHAFEAFSPPSIDIIKLRYEQQSESIKELTDALSSEDNLSIVGGIIIDSMKDVFPPKDPSNPTPKEFMESISAPSLPALIKGVVKANEGVLGKFLGNAGSLLENAVEKVTKAARTTETPPESEPKKTG